MSYYTHLRKFAPESYLSGSKLIINAFTLEGLSGLYEEGLIRGVTQVLGKGWAYQWGRGLYAREGVYRWRNTVVRNRNLQHSHFHKNEMSIYDSVGDILHAR